jgi:sugar lactone lactonase
MMAQERDSTALPETGGATILCEQRCRLGEGPAYDHVRDTAWWFDILECQLYEADLATGKVTRHALPFMASALALIDDERQLIAAENGLYVRDRADGRLSLYVPLEADNAANRSNDGRVHPSGAFWIGTMSRNGQKKAGAIYHVLDGEVSRLYGEVSIPNAICFSPDGKTAYFTDTPEGILNRVEVDPANGKPIGAPTPLYDHRGREGGLDGAIVDAQGLIWNARWGAGCVDAYTPEGQHLRSIHVPASRTSCPVFVGRDFGRMLVTTAYQGMSEAERAADPHHGKTFVMDVGARGRPEPRVRI